MNGQMSFSPFFIFIVLLIQLVQKSEGLTIKLIHPFSFESPFHDSNITSSEMIKMLNLQSRTRKQSFGINDTLRNMKVIHHALQYTPTGYLAKLNLGTFLRERPSYKTYYLHFDIGSDVTWLQCEDCAKPGRHCFHQNGQPYPNSMSTTFVPLPCDKHQLCYPNQCLEEYCSYDVSYDDDTQSFGILAYETLTFGLSETVKVVIGCGIHNKYELLDEYLKNEGGILGMSWGPRSFVNQIATHSHGRFSYCLPPLIFDGFGAHPAILRFGPDIPILHSLHSLPIHQYSQEVSYYVNLQGISINTKRLNIPPQYFTRIRPGHGGCIFDTGTSYSLIPQQAYRILKEEMIHHLASADNSLNLRQGKLLFDLCYWRSSPFKGYNHLPSITFHFEGGVDLVQQPNTAFVVWSKIKKEYICMGLLPSLENNIVTIGSQSQANHVFVFDLPARRMYFGPRDCARNP